MLSAIIFIGNLISLATAKRVPGTVIEIVTNVNSDGYVSYALKVVFREDTTNRRREFISSWSSNPPAYNEDERITVFYDPQNPEKAEIGDFRNLFATPTSLFLFAVFFFFCTFLMIMIRRNIMRRNEMFDIW